MSVVIIMPFVVVPAISVEPVVMPVVAVGVVLRIVAVANGMLVELAFELRILLPVPVVVTVRVSFVDGYFMYFIQVVPPVSRRQSGSMYPAVIAEVNKLMHRHVVIHIHIGDIVILRIIVSFRRPGRLIANINIYT